MTNYRYVWTFWFLSCVQNEFSFRNKPKSWTRQLIYVITGKFLPFGSKGVVRNNCQKYHRYNIKIRPAAKLSFLDSDPNSEYGSRTQLYADLLRIHIRIRNTAIRLRKLQDRRLDLYYLPVCSK
jgi:hypothetical protein